MPTETLVGVSEAAKNTSNKSLVVVFTLATVNWWQHSTVVGGEETFAYLREAEKWKEVRWKRGFVVDFVVVAVVAVAAADVAVVDVVAKSVVGTVDFVGKRVDGGS